MKGTLVALCLALSAPLAVASERSVVVAGDTTPFKVSDADIVRIVGKGIAGSKITAKVAGQAKLESTNAVSERKSGRNVIGSSVTEFEFKATGKGKVTVTVTVAPPNGKATDTKYEFEIE